MAAAPEATSVAEKLAEASAQAQAEEEKNKNIQEQEEPKATPTVADTVVEKVKTEEENSRAPLQSLVACGHFGPQEILDIESSQEDPATKDVAPPADPMGMDVSSEEELAPAMQLALSEPPTVVNPDVGVGLKKDEAATVTDSAAEQAAAAEKVGEKEKPDGHVSNDDSSSSSSDSDEDEPEEEEAEEANSTIPGLELSPSPRKTPKRKAAKPQAKSRAKAKASPKAKAKPKATAAKASTKAKSKPQQRLLDDDNSDHQKAKKKNKKHVDPENSGKTPAQIAKEYSDGLKKDMANYRRREAAAARGRGRGRGRGAAKD